MCTSFGEDCIYKGQNVGESSMNVVKLIILDLHISTSFDQLECLRVNF